MKLHYSQTVSYSNKIVILFYYLMKLHYSQTDDTIVVTDVLVLLPYEITLFSNTLNINTFVHIVLLPYEITLFSNC